MNNILKYTLLPLLFLASHTLADTYRPIAEEVPAGKDYTLTFSLKKLNYDGYLTAPVLVLGHNAALFSQQGQYLGVSRGKKNLTKGTLPGAYKDTDFKATAGETEGWFLKSGQFNGLNGTVIKVQGDTSARTTTFTFIREGKDDTTLTFDSFLNCGDIAINTTTVKSYKKESVIFREIDPALYLFGGAVIALLSFVLGLVVGRSGKKRQVKTA